MQWVKIKDKLPDAGQWCLVCFQYGDMYVAVFHDGEFFPQSQHILTFDGYSNEKINGAKFSSQPINWIPLPEPPPASNTAIK